MGPRGTINEILVNFVLRNQKHNLYLLISLFNWIHVICMIVYNAMISVVMRRLIIRWDYQQELKK